MKRLFIAFGILLSVGLSQDAELTNYKSGIDVTWGVGDGSDKGTAYQEEYFYHDKTVDDSKVVYIKSGTAINFSHNSRNNAQYPSTMFGGNKFKTVGADGLDGIPDSGDEGIIRYKIDRDRQWKYKWAMNSAGTDGANLLPAYSAPFTLASQTYVDSGSPVVGSTGWVGSPSSKSSYHTGIVDSVGDEWHVLSYADDDREFLWGDGSSTVYTVNGIFVDQAFYASDGKLVLLVVNPKTPCFTARVTGTGQFYSTPPKAYFNPKIYDQTTYIAAGASGTVTIELCDINGNNVFYRIGGVGAFTDAGAATVTLDQDDFADGSNILEYYYAGNAAYTKTRTVVKDPTHPSLAETHGYSMWADSTEYSEIVSRVTRAPYYSTYDGYKTRTDVNGQASFDGSTVGSRTTSSFYALENAIVAKISGTSTKVAASALTHLQYAKQMMLRSTPNKIGYELNCSSDAVPNREMWYRGYYDTLPLLKKAFAYDLCAGYFRSDQVTGGMTPIEDYKARDDIASHAFIAMQESMGFNPMGEPGMWGGARMMFGTTAGIIMPEYSTPYFGTSGFGTVQTTYPNCPYDSDEFTWKEALFDGQTRTDYPNFKWNTGLGNNGTGSLFFDEGSTSITYGGPIPKGHWVDKGSYLSSGLMGIHLQIFANMSQRHVGSLDSFLYAATQLMTTPGGIVGVKDNTTGAVTNGTDTITVATAKWADGISDPAPGRTVIVSKYGGVPWTNRTLVSVTNNTTMVVDDVIASGTGSYLFFTSRLSQLMMLNESFPEFAANNTTWVQSLGSTDSRSDDKSMQDAGVFGITWYDDTYLGPVGADTTPPTPSTSTWSVAPFASGDGIAGTATTSTDASSSPVAYRFSVVPHGDAESWSSWQELDPVLLATGLTASTSYDVRVQVRDSVGNTTTASTIATVTTNAANLTTHRNPRLRGLQMH